MGREVVVVAHTHWDREWYEPFQTFRLRLVDLLDDLLPRLEDDPTFTHFLLDGQMAVVDDYLAVRPGAEAELERLNAAGRLAMGPWYILMDEFLVSGETIIRNLQLGLARAAELGGAMTVGYLPDMFGHVAQMPQLLAQFGFAHAVVWRGVPEAMHTSAFWWEAPDGTTVRCEYLPDGYSNGSTLPADARGLLAQIRGFESTYGTLAGAGSSAPLLWMNGTDHQTPRPWLGRVVAEADASSSDYSIRIGSLTSYLNAATTAGLDRVPGELRSGARANLLMGVASNRVDVHQASAIGERTLERLAEPQSALWLDADAWPATLLDEAWGHLIRNSAHDSVCACSADEVTEAVLHRYAEARQIATGLTERAVAAAGRTVGGDRPVVVNGSARPRSALVEITVPDDEPGEGPGAGPQVLATFPAERVLDGITRAQALASLLATIHGADDVVDGEVVVDDAGRVELRLERDPLRAGQPGVGHEWDGPARVAMIDLAEADPDGPARLVVRRAPGRRVLVRATDVPGFGWKRLGRTDSGAEGAQVGETAEAGRRIDTGSAPSGDGGRVAAVTVVDGAIDNGRVRVEVDPAHGTFAIDGRSGFGRLVDDGDAGDTYNYCPPGHDVVVDEPEATTVEVIEAGPLRTRLRITATYRWPERIADDARIGERPVEVVTEIEVHAGERLVRVTTTVDNPCRDHRLRVWFPLPEPATESRAECAFAEVTRGLVAEGGPTEAPMATYPSRRFVQAGGLTVVHEGLLEYELVDLRPATAPAGEATRAHALALTLLRATGVISRGPMATRPLPAGPGTPVEGPQMIGRHRVRYAVQVGPADPYALVDDAFLPLSVADPAKIRGMAAAAPAPDSGSVLTVRGAEVSSLRRVDGHLELRVWNPTEHPTTVEIPGRTGHLVDLSGSSVTASSGQFVDRFAERVELAPWRIATLVLDDDRPA
jgi:mannosylglycerate hydrolase